MTKRGTKMDDKVLLDCPFCGRKAQLESKSHWKGEYIFFVRCTTSNCPGHPIKPICFFDKSKAVEAWNRRVDND